MFEFSDYNRSRPQQMIFVTTKRVNEIQSTTEKLKQDNSGGSYPVYIHILYELVIIQ